MEEEPKPKKAGRPATGKKSSTPNITIPDCLQEEAKWIAKRDGMGYSQWVALAMAKEIARSQDNDCRQAKPPYADRLRKSDSIGQPDRGLVKQPNRHNSRSNP